MLQHDYSNAPKRKKFKSAHLLVTKSVEYVCFRAEGRTYTGDHTAYFHFVLRNKNTNLTSHLQSWGSSVSIVSDYRSEDRGSITSWGKGFFL
jgi:hypothetical protein